MNRGLGNQMIVNNTGFSNFVGTTIPALTGELQSLNTKISSYESTIADWQTKLDAENSNKVDIDSEIKTREDYLKATGGFGSQSTIYKSELTNILYPARTASQNKINGYNGQISPINITLEPLYHERTAIKEKLTKLIAEQSKKDGISKAELDALQKQQDELNKIPTKSISTKTIVIIASSVVALALIIGIVYKMSRKN